MSQDDKPTGAISANVKVNKWNIQEVRVAFDDCVVKFMNEELKFKEDNFLIHLKLLIYFLLNLVGASTALYSYLVKPFERTRLLVGIGSAVYLIGAGIWHLVLQYRVVQTLYRGKDATSNKSVWIRSSIKYPQAIYSLNLLGVKDGKVIGKSIDIGVGEWIDVDGNVLYDLIVKDLQSKLVPKLKQD